MITKELRLKTKDELGKMLAEDRVKLRDMRFRLVGAKLKNFNEKYILKKAVKGIVPQQTIKRKKANFFVPIDKWFKGEVLDMSKQILSKNSIEKQGIFDYKYIDKMWRNYNKSSLFYARQLWSLLCFQIWHKIYIEEGMAEFSEKKAASLFA